MLSRLNRILGNGVTLVILSIVLLVSFGVLFYTDGVVKKNLAHLNQLTIDAERILTADIRSTTSVRLSASLRSDTYVSNYQDFQDTKYALLSKISKLPKTESVKKFFSEMEDVQGDIEEAESEAIELIDEGKWDAALKRVTEAKFRRFKTIYTANLSNALNEMIIDGNVQADNAAKISRLTQVMALFMFILLAVIGVLFTREQRRSLIRQSELAESLEDVNENLEKRVAERTEELDRTQETLRAALDNMAGGIFLIDQNFTLQLFNERFRELYDLPNNVVQVGKSLRDVFQVRAERGEYGPGDITDLVEERIKSYEFKNSSKLEDYVATTGKTLELHRRPLAGGGLVAVFDDITERKAAQAAIEDAHDVMHDSIRYASRIQRSLLPNDELLTELFADHFVIWEPRDVVGGDMYWIKKDR
ncbi:MAG: hypothetical protein HOB79_01590, partial [Rhodospirillaceae bacterium]|nr:hypothetical protein [Rhodospirillaceae bacterium]